MNPKFYLLVTILFFSLDMFAESNPWKQFDKNREDSLEQNRLIIPKEYLVISLDWVELGDILSRAPLRFSSESHRSPVILQVPLPNGKMERFQIFYAPIMHPGLATKYPMIRSYAGVGLDDKTASLRFDVTQFGFHAMILSGNHGGVFIDPYSKGDIHQYISYYKKDFHKEEVSRCFFNEEGYVTHDRPRSANVQSACMLRTYRLALACTGEYAAFHGGNLADVMAAITTTMTRVIGIFERDVSISMELVENNDKLIFLDASTDPFNFFTSFESQQVCDDVIGTANYDIGHLLGIGPGGEAERSSCCVEGLKGSGASTLSSPVGDAFDVNFVAHEFGHQFGCSHIAHKSCNNTPATSVETGNGASVMGQDFFCNPEMEAVRGGYFHTVNILEIHQNIIDGPAGSCAILVDTGNAPPTVDSGKEKKYTLPISTPFKLSAIGNDEDGNSLTYNWEQMDNENAPNPPLSSNTVGPAFRSYDPVDKPYRYFPSLDYLVNGSEHMWEVLPDVAREMNFRVTVRDNFQGAGCTGTDDVDLTFTDNAGPFVLLSPNENETWYQGSVQTVTWDVANTDEAPINCSHVDILLSTDGGFTYPITLVSDAPNDGSQRVLVPSISTNTARVMVLCSDNVFFDISDENFPVEAAEAPTVTLSIDPQEKDICGSNEHAVFNLSFSSLAGFNEAITLDVSGIPSGASFSFSQSIITPPGSADLVVGDLNSVPPGRYTINILGSFASSTIEEEFVLVIHNNLQDSVILTSPENGATKQSLSPTFFWEGETNHPDFVFEIAKTPGFGNSTVLVTSLNTNTYTLSEKLAPLTVYYWRVRSKNKCLKDPPCYSFQTGGEGCYLFNQEMPAYIPGFVTTETSPLFIKNNLNVVKATVSLNIFHKNIGDLSVKLISPIGTSVDLFDRPGFPDRPFGCTSDNMLVTFDDEATNTGEMLEKTCLSGVEYGIEGTFQPITSLSELVGQSTFGEWNLIANDDKFSHAGSINKWSLEFCFMQEPGVPPNLTIMDVMVPELGSKAILKNYLLATSPDISPDQITYTLLTLPTEGKLILNGSIVKLQTKFTQKDINDGLLTYVNINPEADTDLFRFAVTTNDGGWIQNESLHIKISGVLHITEQQNNIYFDLFPNPSGGNVTLQINQATSPFLRLTIIDMMGKIVFEKHLKKNNLNLQESISLQNLPAGSYHLLLSDGNMFGRMLLIKL